MDVARETHVGSARRRCERRLRAWWRQFAIRSAVVTATHHSSYRKVECVEAATQTVDEHIAPAPDAHAAPAPVEPVLSDLQESPVPIVQVVQVLQVQLIEKIIEIPEF